MLNSKSIHLDLFLIPSNKRFVNFEWYAIQHQYQKHEIRGTYCNAQPYSQDNDDHTE